MPGTPPFWAALVALAVGWWWCPRTWRHAFLAAASAAWLAGLSPVSAVVVLGWSGLVYVLGGRGGRWTGRALLAGLFLQLALLKYVPLWTGDVKNPADLALPIGLSYFTFKLAHHVIDRGRGGGAAPTPSTFFAWMLAFPMFTAGPIERLDHFLGSPPDRPRADQLISGCTRLVHGVIKKFFLADVLFGQVLAPVTPHVLVNNPSGTEPHEVLWFLASAFLYNYFDFAGYSDLAVGGCRLLGIEVVENFDSPVLATDLGDFWRRWHRSLAAWCQRYVYLPVIGGTRNPFLAVYATFAAMGVWHLGTPNWLCWGLWHATGISISLAWARQKRRWAWKLEGRLPGLAARVLTLSWVLAGYAFTGIQGHGGVWDAVRILGRLLGLDLPEHPW